MKRRLCSALLIFLVLGSTARADLFKDGERVCFLGDSITHGRQFHSLIYAYYLTRFPDRTIHFVNAGVSGDSAGGALGRLDEDVLSKSPTTVVVMLGMNDVGRGNYVANPSEAQTKAQQAALDRYRASMDALLGRLQSKTSARLVLLTPSPFDQTCVNERDNNQPGCNDGLAKCGEIGRELARKYHAEVINLHGPMTDLNLQQQKTDPSFTLIGPDRVHPGLPGNLVMAYLFLKAQGAPALVSRVSFDAAAGRVVEADNATVNNVERAGAGWKFTVLEKALPYPIDPQAREVLDLIPLEKELDQEVVQVKGLGDGSYSLWIDGQKVATHSAAQWSDGINLALNPATPQAKQAEKVAEINEARRRAEVRLRNYAAVRWFLRHRRVDPNDLAAVKAYAETKMAKTGYYEAQVPTYLKEWEGRGEIVAQVAALEQETLRARTPVAHVYEIRPEQ